MSNYLRIKPSFSIIAHSSDCVELRSGIWNPVSHVIKDDSQKGYLYNIIKSLDGSVGSAEIASLQQVPRSEVESLIDYLNQLQVLEKSHGHVLDHYFDIANPAFYQPSYSNKPLACKFPVLFFENNLITHSIEQNLKQQLGDEVSIEYLSKSLAQLLSDSDDALFHDPILFQEVMAKFSDLKNKLIVMAAMNIDPVCLLKWNRIAHALKLKWLFLAIDGPLLLIGPLFNANGGPCFECFETRVMMNMREHASYLQYKKAVVEKQITHPNKPSVLGLFANMVSAHASLEIINYITTENAFILNKVFAIYLPTMEMSYSEVIKHASCQSCGLQQKSDEGQLYFDFHTVL